MTDSPSYEGDSSNSGLRVLAKLIARHIADDEKKPNRQTNGMLRKHIKPGGRKKNQITRKTPHSGLGNSDG